MRESIANLVYPVFSHGLELRERLDNGETPDLEHEQATLKGRLGGNHPAAWAQAGAHLMPRDPHASVQLPPRPVFHYALVCWLDEIFSDSSAWGEQWTARTLEHALYGTRDRAWKFPEQANQAINRSSPDDLEVFYLCVMLGFRGDWRDDPTLLRTWIDAVETRLEQQRAGDWPERPGEREAPGGAPPRRARDHFQRMISVAVAAVLLVIPLATFYLVWRLGQ